MLEISHLVKQFGPLVAVDDVSFAVPVGEVLGFLGPNGAGKSTTMKMITGFLAPTSGTAIICGHDILAQPVAAKRQIGYLPEGAPAYPDMTTAEFLVFIAQIRGYRGADARKRIGYIAELINITDVMRQPIETLSKGYRRRVGVAQALLHDPAVLILDEPTDGLDPNQKHEMRGIIEAMSASKAIIISTHLLEEVEAICSRAIIIARGRILADGTPAELAARSRFHNAVRLGLAGGGNDSAASVLASLPAVASVEATSEGDGYWLFPRGDQPIVTEVAALAQAHRWTVTGIQVERGRLDDVFRTITTPPGMTSPAAMPTPPAEVA
ncbi:MAG TPA: ATP-binding cassette domain-containing protein [Stellaceae bacterium]|jgi:ABC-2 type transport system ATP-binding protein|nr:ATP-binding cassette domain-containing protein [Stellaceae bacterium]